MGTQKDTAQQALDVQEEDMTKEDAATQEFLRVTLNMIHSSSLLRCPLVIRLPLPRHHCRATPLSARCPRAIHLSLPRKPCRTPAHSASRPRVTHLPLSPHPFRTAAHVDQRIVVGQCHCLLTTLLCDRPAPWPQWQCLQYLRGTLCRQ